MLFCVIVFINEILIGILVDIKDKVVIVTGASGGIGLATARLFAARGAKVALAARSIEKLKDLEKELPGSFAVQTDMKNEAEVRQLINDVYNHYGRIDVLINNAGQGMHVPVISTDLKSFREILELNVVSVLAAMEEAVPVMKKQGYGVIINISSGLSKRIVPGVGPYASTKYALNCLTLTARMELEKDNIKVGLVIPGITATDFFKNAVKLNKNENLRPQGTYADSAEHVAEKILEAVETEAAEVYSDSIKPAGA